MPVVEGDFGKIAANQEPLEKDTQYRFQVISMTDQDNPEWKAQNPGKTPAFIVQSEVSEGDRAGTEYSDFIYLTSKEGKPIKRGLARVKAYAEAILGKEAANGTKINTDDFLNGEFFGITKAETYTTKDVPPVQKTSIKIGTILPISN